MGVPITGTLTQYSGGQYPTHNDQIGWGGLRVVADHTARNAIPSLQRRVGMVVVCISDSLGDCWQLNTATNTGTDADWTAANFGGGGGGAGTRNFGWAFALNSDAIVATDISPWVILTKTTTFASWWTAAKVGPVGADLVVDVLISTDGGATFNTLWTATPANRPKVAAGSTGNTGTTFAVTTGSPGDLLRFDVVQIGSTTAGSGVSVAILGALS